MKLAILVALIAGAVADLGDTNPPYGSCLCVEGRDVRVRDNAGLSSNTIGYVDTGDCFKYLGLRLTTDGYRWFKIDYNGRDGWTAGNFLNVASSSKCSSGGCSSGESRLTHSAAASRLSSAGIPIYSSGGCSDRNLPYCTSLDTIRCKCIDDVIWFKQTSGCSVTVTGGTETGHSSGSQSHWNGYKLDIALNSCVNGYIQGRFSYIGIRGDGSPMYRDSRGNTYAKEGSHWDILYP